MDQQKSHSSDASAAANANEPKEKSMMKSVGKAPTGVLPAAGARKKVSTDGRAKPQMRRVATAKQPSWKEAKKEPTMRKQKSFSDARGAKPPNMRRKKSADLLGVPGSQDPMEKTSMWEKVKSIEADATMGAAQKLAAIQKIRRVTDTAAPDFMMMAPGLNMEDLNSDCEGAERAKQAGLEDLANVTVLEQWVPDQGVQRLAEQRRHLRIQERYRDPDTGSTGIHVSNVPQPRDNLDWIHRHRKIKIATLPEAEKAQSQSTTHDWPKHVKKLKVDYREVINTHWRTIRANMDPKEIYVPSLDEALKITYAAYKIFKKEPNLIDLRPGITIVGDIHGQCPDLMAMLAVNGPPPRKRYCFLGDYVDRGGMSLQVINMLLCYKILFPRSVTLLRGNHEIQRINARYGFTSSVEKAYGAKHPEHWQPLYYLYNKAFNYMPMAALIATKILCMHGGISPQIRGLDDIRLGKKPVRNPCYGFENDLMWADPEAGCCGWKKPTRGSGCIYGEEVLDQFCRRNGIDLVVRAHQVVIGGFIYSPSCRLVTLFSAPMYTNAIHNCAALMHVDKDLRVKFSCFVPESHGVILRIAGYNRIWDESVNYLGTYSRPPF